jgi:predicted ATPase
VEVGKAALELFPHGVWFVGLAPLSASEPIMTAAAAVMGLPLQSHEDPQSQLLQFLQGKRLLLIFDNLEHLLPEASQPLETIMKHAGDSRMLVTSRQPIDGRIT